MYTILVFGFGIYIGYSRWKKVFSFRRKVMSWIQTDWFVDFHQEDDQQPNRSGLDLREWAVRASLEATGGEWVREPPPPLPAPLRRRGASRVGRQREGPEAEGSFDEEEEWSRESRGTYHEEEEPENDVTVEQYLTDWDPELHTG